MPQRIAFWTHIAPPLFLVISHIPNSSENIFVKKNLEANCARGTLKLYLS